MEDDLRHFVVKAIGKLPYNFLVNTNPIEACFRFGSEPKSPVNLEQ